MVFLFPIRSYDRANFWRNIFASKNHTEQKIEIRKKDKEERKVQFADWPKGEKIENLAHRNETSSPYRASEDDKSPPAPSSTSQSVSVFQADNPQPNVRLFDPL